MFSRNCRKICVISQESREMKRMRIVRINIHFCLILREGCRRYSAVGFSEIGGMEGAGGGKNEKPVLSAL